jgi:hypothetical protein
MKPGNSWSEQWARSTTRRFLIWLSSWRTMRRALLGLASLVTLIALFYAVVNWRGSRAWRAHSQELKALGESIDLAGLIPPPVAEQDNLAAAPLFRPLFDTTRTEAGLEWRDPEGKKRLDAFKLPSTRQRGRPPECTLGSLHHDCWTDLGACLRFYLEQEQQAPELAGESDAARLLSYLQRHDGTLDELAEAARQRPACRFPVAYDVDIPFAILLPHLAPVKGMAGVLALRAIARMELGHNEAAFRDLELGLRLSESIADEPILISHLVRVATLNLNLQVLREGIARRTWTEPQLSAVQSKLAAIDLLSEARQAFRGERACVVGAVDYMRRLGVGGRANELGSILGSSEPGVEQILQLLPDGFFYANMLKLSQLHQQHSLGALDVAAHRLDLERAKALESVVEDLPLRPSTVFVRILMPALAKASARTAQGQTYLDAAQVACALERRRLAAKELPTSLDELVPDLLPKVPTDIIDGQPVRYQLRPGGGYVLYGVGWNRQDDGGSPGWIGEGSKAQLSSEAGDWVWSMK